MDIVLKAKPSETQENTALYNFFVWTGSKGNSSPATRIFGGTQNNKAANTRFSKTARPSATFFDSTIYERIATLCLQCLSSNVFSKRLHDLAKLHWLHLFDFSPLCVFKCLLKFFYSTTLNGPIATLCLRLFGLCDRLERGSVIYVWLAPTLSCNSRIKLESILKLL